MKLIPTQPQEIWETRFLLNCLPIIKDGLILIEIINNEIKKSNLFNLTFTRKNKLDTLKECIESLINFCYFDTKNYAFFNDINMDYVMRKPNIYRQNILHEQGFISLLSQLIKAAFPDEESLFKVN